MPVGAFGGARAVMARLAPLGDTYQAGTLSGNPVAMAAGLATLDLMLRDSGWQTPRGPRRGARAPGAAGAGAGAVPGAPGARRLAVLAGAARGRRAAHRRDPRASAPPHASRALFHAMLDRGVYLPPSAYEACFLSLAHTSADLARFAQALREIAGRRLGMKAPRVFQLTALALVVVSAVQVGWWLLDQHSHTRRQGAGDARTPMPRSRSAAQALLEAGTAAGARARSCCPTSR